jgi:ATP-dependent DNA ligase
MQIDSFKYFYPERPRLLHIEQPLFEQLSQDPNWVAEPKYNGSRLQLHFVAGAWQFWNRHEQPMVYTPSPEVFDALAGLNLKGYWLFDGELRHKKTRGISHKIVLYDVFIRQGDLLLGQPFADRRGILETLLHYHGDYHVLGLAPQYEENFRQVFGLLTQDEEIEGLVLKNLQGQLQLGRSRAAESRWMWKVRQPSGRYQF